MAQASARRRWLRYAAWTAAAGIAAGVALAVVVATRFQSEDLARLYAEVPTGTRVYIFE